MKRKLVHELAVKARSRMDDPALTIDELRELMETLLEAVGEKRERSPRNPEAEAAARADVEHLFNYWKSRCGYPRARLIPAWSRKLAARLSERSLDDLCKVADFGAQDPWLNGTDPKAKRRYNGIDTLFRTEVQVERYLECARDYERRKPQ